MDAFRKMFLPRRRKNPATGVVEKVKVPTSFYQATYYEILTLTTGDQGYNCLGNGASPTTPKNYSASGKNPLNSQQGQVLAVNAVLLGPSGAVFNPQSTSGEAAATADAAQQWINQLEIYLWRNSQKVHQSVGVALLPEMPILYSGATANFDPSAVNLGNGSPENRNNFKRGIFLHPPVDLAMDSTFYVQLKCGLAVPAGITTCQLLMLITLNEFPVSAEDMIRE